MEIRMSTERNYDEAGVEGRTVTSMHLQVQETLEAYYVLERDLDACMLLLQEAAEVYEEGGEDLTPVMDKIRELLDGQQL